MQLAVSTTLADLAGDLRAAAWFLAGDDPLRGFLVLLAALPPEEAAWEEVVVPRLDELRRGLDPRPAEPRQFAAAGAVGVAAIRAARELPLGSPLAAALRAVARWCFWVVDPAAH